jgi:hypothetical protein
MKYATVTTTLRPDEVPLLDELAEPPYGRAGVARAMLRFAMENRAAFDKWLEANTGETFYGYSATPRAATEWVAE